MRVSEAEIVADCCDELESVRLKCLASAATTDQLQPQPHGHKLSSAIICNNNKTTVETFFEDDRLPDGGDAGGAGEDVSIQLNAFNRQVLDTRRAFFDREKALTNPRLFLLPATNEKGRVIKLLLVFLDASLPIYRRRGSYRFLLPNQIRQLLIHASLLGIELPMASIFD